LDKGAGAIGKLIAMRIAVAGSIKHRHAKLRKPRPSAPTAPAFDNLGFKERLRRRRAGEAAPPEVRHEVPGSIELRGNEVLGVPNADFSRSTFWLLQHDEIPDLTKGSEDRKAGLVLSPTIGNEARIDDNLNSTAEENLQCVVELNESRAQRNGRKCHDYQELSHSFQLQRADPHDEYLRAEQCRKDILSPSQSQAAHPDADISVSVQALPSHKKIVHHLNDDRGCLPSQSRERLRSSPPTRLGEQPLPIQSPLTLPPATIMTDSGAGSTESTESTHLMGIPSVAEIDGLRQMYSRSRTESIAHGELIAEESEKYVVYTPPSEPLSVGAVLRAAAREPTKVDSLTIVGNCDQETVFQEAEMSAEGQRSQKTLSPQTSVDLMSGTEDSEAPKTTEYSYPLPKGFHYNTDLHATLKAIQYRKWPDHLCRPPT